MSEEQQERAKVGVIVPLFVSPARDQLSWIQLAGTARRYPRVDIIAAVDVNQGPGLGPDITIREGVKVLKNNAVTVLGYIMIDPQNNENDIKQQMINWKNWYPEIDGFYLDGVPRELGYVDFYNEVVDYAKNFLMTPTIVAELDHVVRTFDSGVKVPNTDIPRELVDRTHIDLFVIYRGRGLPKPLSIYKTAAHRGSIMGKWTEQDYPSHRFGIIATKMDITQTTEIENFIREAMRQNVARYFYIQTDSGAREIHPEPFVTLSSFFEPIVILLDNIASTEGKLPTPQPTEETTIAEQPIVIPGGRNRPEQEITIRPSTRTIEESMAAVGDKDRNGVQKMYPTAVSGGKPKNEWYFRQDGQDPTKDDRLKNWKDINLRKMQDRSGAFYMKGGKKKEGIRLEVWSQKGKNTADTEAYKFLNTETTVYFYYIRDVPGSKKDESYAFQIYTRSGHHSDKNPCEGACYKSALHKDGRSAIRKEIAHGIYAENRAVQQGVTAHGIIGNWVGFKQVVYNLSEDQEPNTYVVIENYVDQNCTDSRTGNLVVRNNWVLTSRFIDMGVVGGTEGIGWALLNKKEDEKKLAKLKCKSLDLQRQGEPRKASDIINTPGGTSEGNCVVLSAEGVEMKIKNFSVREIVAPAED